MILPMLRMIKNMKKTIKTDNAIKNKSEISFKSDGWSNLILSMNGLKDKSQGFDYTPNSRLTILEQDEIYRGDAIAAKICDLPAQDMTRQGLILNHPKAKAINEEYDKLNLFAVLEDALRYENAFGGSAVIMDIDDGQEDWSLPVNFNNIKGINDFFAIDRYYLNSTNTNPLKKADLYNINSLDNHQQIHRSRMLVFTGIDTGIRNRQLDQGFGQSRIDRIMQELRNYGIGHNVIPNIIIEFVQGIFKLKGMKEKIAENKDAVIQKRMMYLSALMNASNKIVLDSEDDYVNKTINVSGIDKLIDILERRLCAAAGIPHTHILEESPGSSLSQSGDSQTRKWYDWVKSQQERKLRPEINKLNMIIAAYLKIPNPETILFEFVSLYQQKEAEIVANRKIVAETDLIYHDMGLPPETIINNRFADGKYNYETSITPSDITAIKNNKKLLDTQTKQINNPQNTNNQNKLNDNTITAENVPKANDKKKGGKNNDK